MKFLTPIATALLLSSVSVAFADTSPSVCLTINRPTKWSAGLVLRIFSNFDGTKGATLLQLSMFHGTSGESPTGQGLGTISGITVGKTGTGESTYVGGDEGRKINAVLSAPDQYGGMSGSIDIQLAGMDIRTKGAGVTRFSGNAKCE